MNYRTLPIMLLFNRKRVGKCHYEGTNGKTAFAELLVLQKKPPCKKAIPLSHEGFPVSGVII